MRHRQDIDGLRALAVIPVVLFHAGVKQIPGGFVGVDIFFVISGFLITSLILGEMSESRFSLLHFYERRVRRIFPALFLVLAFCSVTALLLFLPKELKDYDRALIAATFFVSNIHFYYSYDYFAAPLDTSPLLHTWSLAIEEQFYIVFPLLLIVSMNWGRRIAIAVIAVLFALSLAASIIMTPINEAAAFYLAPMRAWELLLGALLAAGVAPRIASRAAREVVALGGIALIAYALFFFDEITLFPSWTALIPVLGAALVIHAGEDGRETVVAKALSLSPLVFIGLISYSLYLWHWPLLVFARYWNLFPLSGWQAAIAVVASFMLAALSWKYVEQPFRRRKPAISRRNVAATAAAMLALFVVMGVATASGWKSRFSHETLAAFADIRLPRGDKSRFRACARQPIDKPCVIGAAVSPTIAVWGDSHALMMLPAFDQVGRQRGLGFEAFFTPGCPPLPGLRFVESGKQIGCKSKNAETLSALESARDITTVILLTRTVGYLGGDLGAKIRLANAAAMFRILGPNGEPLAGPELAAAWERELNVTVSRLLTAGKRVVLVYPTPDFTYSVPEALARSLVIGRSVEDLDLPIEAFRKRSARVFEILDRIGNSPRLLRVYPHKRLCDAERCLASADGKALYKDDNHLSPIGAARVLPEFESVFADGDGKSPADATSALQR